MEQSNTFKIRGMHCASCAGIIEKEFKKTDGVISAEANYGTESVKVTYDESKTHPEALSQKVEHLGYSLILPTADEMGMSAGDHAEHLGLTQSKKEKLAEVADMRTKVITAIPLAVISILIMAWDIAAQLNALPAMSYVWSEFIHHLLPLMATYMLFVVGKPYLLGFYRFLRYGNANMDTLIGIGTTAAYTYSFIIMAFQETLRPFINVDHTYYDVTIVVIAFITLGKYFEAREMQSKSSLICKLKLRSLFVTAKSRRYLLIRLFMAI
jgi:Cu+-exporting ATPase